MKNDEKWMQIAIEEAQLAEIDNEVPVGAIIIKNNKIIAKAHNQPISKNDPTAHAEVLAIQDAAKKLGTSRVDGATLISTLEPCPMCAGAALSARVARVVFGAEDPKAGALGSLYQLGSDPRLNHEFSVTPRVLQEECGVLISKFFQSKRD